MAAFGHVVSRRAELEPLSAQLGGVRALDSTSASHHAVVELLADRSRGTAAGRGRGRRWGIAPLSEHPCEGGEEFVAAVDRPGIVMEHSGNVAVANAAREVTQFDGDVALHRPFRRTVEERRTHGWRL